VTTYCNMKVKKIEKIGGGVWQKSRGRTAEERSRAVEERSRVAHEREAEERSRGRRLTGGGADEDAWRLGWWWWLHSSASLSPARCASGFLCLPLYSLQVSGRLTRFPLDSLSPPLNLPFPLSGTRQFFRFPPNWSAPALGERPNSP
jgi:hypothetical protein